MRAELENSIWSLISKLEFDLNILKHGLKADIKLEWPNKS